ncbi:hypothetical protein SAMN05660964_00787 [Thiothrix caldifontis]|jgi:hypothetical protein|uniref:Uncharacterized protein n=1 Tax=Thiothrix caldifontis TaxID=525918 RepID=A0A1H3XRL5_9GAMM|nr:hypothetical protein [Thiothrix caldifontis]SEA02105.1 hypothetical protein SAMN05660964_00787 [Thiothrix caldifontis]
MNMKKMRGAIDPITLGFLITAAIGIMSAHTSARIQQTPAVQQGQVQPINVVYLTHQQ